ncbi:MAG TPA: DUF389 domain-containing protein, partial [Parvularculaceae bacterium]|nr:DUF389 domain-containing protein [Parvularculaceae bacterium]
MSDRPKASPFGLLDARPAKAVIRLWRRMAGNIDHNEVVREVVDDGSFTGRYAFMIAMACGIATLGLLLSSPAVIIGAMLISPLMGPIVKLGFSLSIFDLKAMRTALMTLGVGVFLALAISYGIVKFSPLTQATPEIIARTRPNLFDLLVAVFSGLAGGYAVINRKGATIVGVAIATALMPPLAVVGYGLASQSGAIASGAAFLFMTNLLAISLTVSMIATFYGFGVEHARKTAGWQALLIIAVFAALSVPLGISLRKIAFEARITALAQSAAEAFYDGSENRFSDFSIRFDPNDAISIDATVLTKDFDDSAEERLAAHIAERLNAPVALNLDQVLVDQARAIDSAEILRLTQQNIAAPLQAQIAEMNRRDLAAQEIRNAASFAIDSLNVDDEARAATIAAAPSRDISLAGYREMEAELGRRFTNWRIRVRPAPQALPPLFFETGGVTLSTASLEDLETIFWALDRWGVDEVTVVGYASTAGALQRFDNRQLAFRRAETVSALFEERSVNAEAIGEYQSYRQSAKERELGLANFQRVDIRI